MWHPFEAHGGGSPAFSHSVCMSQESAAAIMADAGGIWEEWGLSCFRGTQWGGDSSVLVRRHGGT